MSENNKTPGGIICENCRTCIFRFIAVTTGRCWRCKAQLNSSKPCEQGR